MLSSKAPPPKGWPDRTQAGPPAPLRSSPITEPSSLLRTLLPLCPASVLRHLWCPPLALLPSHRDDRFSCSSSKPDSCSRRLYAGHQWGTMQVTPPPHPAAITTPRFRYRLGHFDTSSTVHLRSTPRISPDAVIATPFPSTLTTRTLYPSSSWRFEACSWQAGSGGPAPIFDKASNAAVPSFLVQRQFRTHDDA